MPLLTIPEIMIDEDAVLRGQGADPQIIRQRNSRLLEVSKRALEGGMAFLEPQVFYQKLKVDTVQHERVVLENGKKLSGPLIINHLGPAEYVVLLLCTVGHQIDEQISVVMNDDMLLGLALDGVGSAAVEALANAACKHFEDQAAEEGCQSTIPLSPGMLGWEVGRGQPEIFSILDAAQIGVQLSDQAIMTPRKSLSMVIGFGTEMKLVGKTCDYCAMKDTCRYKDHYEEVQAGL